MKARPCALFLAVLAAATGASPARPARADDKVTVLCGGDLDICKMTSELLRIRLAVAEGTSFEAAAQTHASWAWRDGALSCLAGTTGNTPELLQACADVGLVVVDTSDAYGVHTIVLSATGIAGLEALAHRPEVRGVTVAPLGTTHPLPPPDPAQSQRLRVRSGPNGSLRYAARSEWWLDDGSTALPVTILVGDVEVVSGELVRSERSPRRWELRTGTEGREIVVSLDDGTGALRLVAKRIDTTGIDRTGPSIRVTVRLGTPVSRNDLVPRRRARGGTIWTSDR